LGEEFERVLRDNLWESRMIVFKIPDKLYYADIKVIVCCSCKEIDDYFQKKYKIPYSIDKDAHCMTVEDKGKLYRHYIIVPVFDWTIPQQAVLIHELFHLTCRVMNDVGIALSDDSEEAYAYYLQYLSKETMRTLLIKTGYASKQVQKTLAGD